MSSYNLEDFVCKRTAFFILQGYLIFREDYNFVSKTAGETPASTVWHIWTFMAAFTASAIEETGR